MEAGEDGEDEGELIDSRDPAWFVALTWFALRSFFLSWLILRYLKVLLRQYFNPSR